MEYDRLYVVAVDFDNTLTRGSTYARTGSMNPEAVEYVKKLKDLGCVLVLWTTRSSEDLLEAKNLLSMYDVPIDFYNEYPNRESSNKVNVDFYIDDKSYPGGEIEWKKIYDFIKSQIEGGNYVLCK